jgi:predicted dehydrogenase
MTHHFTRRTFLASTTAAGISLAARPTARAAAANDTVVIAIMGANNRGSQLATSLIKLPGVKIACICDCDSTALAKGIAAASANGNPAPRGIKDFREALDDKSIDALFCAAPNHWHAPATILACAAGKHVYSEKPCSHTPAEGERMIAAARDSERVVQIGLQRRSNPHYVEAAQRLTEGAIGRILYASSTYNNRRPSIGHSKPTAPPPSLDYDLWQGPALAEPYRDNVIPYNWHNFWTWGNAEIGNNGVHTIDVCRWMLGVDFPTKVTAAGSKLRYDDDAQTPDTCTVTWQFGDRAMGWDGKSWSPSYGDGQDIGMELRGEDGILTINDSGYKIYNMQRKLIDQKSGHRTEAEHLTNFLNAIRTGEKLNCPVEEGHKSTLLAHLANISYRTGQTLEVDPATGHIQNNAEAEKLWSCNYRPGWFPAA